MKALSLTQPWATLIALAGHPDPDVRAMAKKIETRSWGTEYRGPLAIHATRKWDASVVDWVLHSEAARPIRDLLPLAGYWRLSLLPLGSILCVGDLDWCRIITGDNAPPEPERSFGDYTPGRWAWHFDNVRTLPTPVPTRGNRRLWTPVPDLLSTLEQFYKEMAPDAHRR